MTSAHVLNDLPAPLRLATPATPEVVLVPFHMVRRSSLNPRKHFDHPALVELARNIHERTPRDEAGTIIGTGILQNLLGRSVDGGGVEIAAGERRQRAVELLVQGLTVQVQSGEDANGRPVMQDVTLQVPGDYPMPFRVEALSNADLLEIATVENVMREDMSLMETADAFMALIGLGRSEDYVALKYGKHPSTVRAYVQLAAGLGREGRKLLEEGRITVEHAKLIASTTGALKKSLTEHAVKGTTVSHLRNLTRNAAFLVDNALFDVAGSGLRIEEGLLGDLPPKFADHKAALSAQLEVLERMKAEAQAQGEWTEVVVLPVENEYAYSTIPDWTYWNASYEGVPRVLLLTYSTRTGKVNRQENMARVSDVEAYRKREKAATKAKLREITGDTDHGKIRDAAHLIAQQTRCMALDGYLAAHPLHCLALACQSLMLREGERQPTTLMGLRAEGRKDVPLTPEGQALAGRITERFPSLFTRREDGGVTVTARLGNVILDALTAEDVTAEDLLNVLTYFTHRETGAWTQATGRPSPELRAYAQRIGADTDVQRRFTLSSEYLNAYTGADLATLITTMPDALRPTFKPGASKKEIVALIMEKAPALAENGWLPDLVKFVA